MNVWIMNLRDNRDVRTEESNKIKFDFCKTNDILGIGWVGYDESSNDNAFLLANKYIDEFEVGDLVWTKNDNNEYYLCRITSKAVKTDDEKKNNNEIGKFCSCRYILIGALPEGIDNKELIARHTIERANESVSSITKAFFISKYVGNDDLAIHNTSEKKSFFTGKNIMIISVCAVLIVSIILVVLLAETGDKQNKQIKSNIVTSNTDSKEKTGNNTSSIKMATDYLPTTAEMMGLLKKYFSGEGINFENWVKSGTDDSIMQAPDGTGAIVNSSNGFLTFSLKAQKDVILYDPNCRAGQSVFAIRSWSYDVYEILEVMLSGIPNELKPNTYELKASAENITTGYSPSIKKSGLEYKIGINNGKPVEIIVTK